MLTVYDCSNSAERPTTRKYGGPLVNEFVGLLHKYADDYAVSFVDTLQSADIVFTNDVFTQEVLQSNKPRVKRMDGVFWQRELFDRNIPFVIAASQADRLIFITDYSKNSMQTFYPDLMPTPDKWLVLRHWTEPYETRSNRYGFPHIFLAMATNWNRAEKRYDELIKFASVDDHMLIHVVGTPPTQYQAHPRIKLHGYMNINANEFIMLANSCDAFVNFTCKDASTKTVCTAINIGLPVLYAGSGGVSELVDTCGCAISEIDKITVLDEIPSLDRDAMVVGYNRFANQYDQLATNVGRLDVNAKFRSAIAGYFYVFQELA